MGRMVGNPSLIGKIRFAPHPSPSGQEQTWTDSSSRGTPALHAANVAKRLASIGLEEQAREKGTGMGIATASFGATGPRALTPDARLFVGGRFQ